jgi:predicted nucleic acid-binding protein
VTLVVDTSVVLKWIVAEQDSALAESLIGMPLTAPDLLRAELANALWKKVLLRKELTAAQASLGLTRASAALRLVPSIALADRALSLGLTLSHPVYDCFFLALAEELDVPLLTADDRFLARLKRERVGERAISLKEWTPDD